MKKTNSTEEVSGLVVKGQKGRSKSKRPKRHPEASNSFACYFCKKSGHTKKNYMKYKEMLKKKDGKHSDRVSEKVDQVGIVEKADENPYDVLTTESGKDKYSDA